MKMTETTTFNKSCCNRNRDKKTEETWYGYNGVIVMGNFLSEELINEIKDANEIIDVISQYIQVKRWVLLIKHCALFITKKPPLLLLIKKNKSINVLDAVKVGM